MTKSKAPLLTDIEAFLQRTGLSASHFSKCVGPREMVARLRSGGRVWPETEAKARAFMRDYRPRRRKSRAPGAGSPEPASGVSSLDSGAGAARSGLSQNSEIGGPSAETRRREARSPARAAADFTETPSERAGN